MVRLTDDTLIDTGYVMGADGKDGKDGRDGIDGRDGRDGADGRDGVDGTDGIDGVDGKTPYIGDNGNWWIGEDDTGVKAEAKEEFIFDKGGNGTILLAYVGTNDSVVIPEKTTGIAKYAFINNDSIKTVYIPSNVEYIGEYAFADCTGLKSVTYDNNNSYAGVYDGGQIYPCAFDNCLSLTNVTLGTGVQLIDDEAFNFCKSLASINLDNVRFIGNFAFWHCDSLSGTLKTGAYNIGQGAFGWTGYSEAVFTCTDSWVTSATGVHWWWGWNENVFFGADNLKSITLHLETPPFCHNIAEVGGDNFDISFGGTSDSFIYVPAESIDAYKAADGWKDYADKIQAMP